MTKKILPLLAAFSAALIFNACGDDSSSSAPDIECLDNENCLEESSSSEEAKSSSSVKGSSSSEEAKSSSSAKEDGKSSSSAKDDGKSSSSEKAESSSSVTGESSSSEEAESSSSVAVEYEYLSTTPNIADLEVSGDTLYAIFQRYVYDAETWSTTFADNGLLALYKVSDGTLLDTIQLATKNPMAVKVVKGNVYVASHGEYNAAYGTDADENRGIERVDLKNKTSKLYVAGTKLGGGISDFAVNTKTNKAYAAINLFYGSVPVVEVDLATGSVKAIDGIKDGSGSIAVDEAKNLVYIGDRFMDFTTFEMQINVMVYDGSKLTMLSDAEEDEFRQPYSVKLLGSTPYVFVSDYSTGKLYWNYADSEDDEDGLEFDQDSKLAVANGKLFVMSRTGAGSVSLFNTESNEVVWQKSVDNGNPYDVVQADGSNVWVALHGLAEIRKISVADGSTMEVIDTEEFCAKKVKE